MIIPRIMAFLSQIVYCLLFVDNVNGMYYQVYCDNAIMKKVQMKQVALNRMNFDGDG